MKSNILNRIKGIILLDSFKLKLSEVNDNFQNLKQELHIRDLITSQYNSLFLDSENIRAFAEFKVGKKRVDLAFLKRKEVLPVFLTEIKFQYTGDFENEKDWGDTIKNDFTLSQKSDSGIDLFILIILEWISIENRKDFECNWNIPKLSKYAQRNEKTDLSSRIKGYFEEYGEWPKERPIDFAKVEVGNSIYNFYFLYKNIKNERY